MKKIKLCVFASGGGSNFQSILNAIDENRLDAEVVLLITNNPDAGALKRAEAHNIPTSLIVKSTFPSRDIFVQTMLETLQVHGTDLVVLAGYLKKIPPEIITTFRHRIVNIHPALLPSFGGKGMYGHHVHQAVIKRGCKVTGATIHIVDEVYDHGPIVAQRCVPVEGNDTPDELAARVLKTEHKLYPEALQLFAENRVTVSEGRVIVLPRRVE